MSNRNRFVFNDDVSVYDSETTLVLLRNANYWKKAMGWNDANIQIERLNQDNFGGFDNWRLPTLQELKSISLSGILADYGNAGGPTLADYFNSLGFYEVLPDWYWSSDTHTAPPNVSNTDDKWCVNMGEKDCDSFHFATKRYIWPVRESRR